MHNKVGCNFMSIFTFNFCEDNIESARLRTKQHTCIFDLLPYFQHLFRRSIRNRKPEVVADKIRGTKRERNKKKLCTILNPYQKVSVSLAYLIAFILGKSGRNQYSYINNSAIRIEVISRLK